MNNIVVGILLVALIGGGYFLGKSQSDVLEPKTFIISNQITPEQELGIAQTDIFTWAEVCPSGGFFIFQGSGRIFVTGVNTFHYTLLWDPTSDITSTVVDANQGVFDIKVMVKGVAVRMEKPDIDVTIIDKSLFVDDKDEKASFQLAMLDRMDLIAKNKLTGPEGQTQLTNAIKSTIYDIYSSSDLKIRNINVVFSEGSLPKYVDPSFLEECKDTVISIADRFNTTAVLGSPQISGVVPFEIPGVSPEIGIEALPKERLEVIYEDNDFNLIVNDWVTVKD